MDYAQFLQNKIAIAAETGVQIAEHAVHPLLKPHQRDMVRWAVAGGRRGLFASFGLGKTLVQLEICRLLSEQEGGAALIVCPLGVRQEFARDARLIGLETRFIRETPARLETGIYLTNYESVRNEKLDPRGFSVVSLDEAAILRGFGGTKTFRTFMGMFEGTSTYRFVATATPDPNEYIELLAYAAFLGIMDVGEAKTRWFKRDATKADKLTLHKHKEDEFWLWVASWALFVQKPSDLGYDNTGYELPPIVIRWHEIPTDHSKAVPERDGQGRMFKDVVMGLSEAASEKRDSLEGRLAKAQEIMAEAPDDHYILWHNLEAERHAITRAIPAATAVYGSQDLDEREGDIMAFANGELPIIAAKPVMLSAGVNFQRYCHRAIFMGIDFKFNDLLQGIHRIQRFLQPAPVIIDFIYTEAERSIKKIIEDKWSRYDTQCAKMAGIIQEYGLAHAGLAHSLQRSIGVARQEVIGEQFTLVNNDTVIESQTIPDASVDLIVTSIPFAFQYEYTPSYNDFGNTESNDHFWAQMDYLTPNLLRVLQPGRIMAIHIKDRIVPGGLTGLGFQTLHPFHAEAIFHYQRHGFAFLGMKTVVTDVVRENNQTYRLGWSEQCKDGSRMGCGVPEYVLLFRKPPSDSSNGYGDVPIVKEKPNTELQDGAVIPYDYDAGKIVQGTGYSRARWQLDAHGFARSSGNRLLTPEELDTLPHADIFKRWREESLATVYDFERHVAVGEAMEREKRLPSTFMLMPPHSNHPDVWTDVARMRTLNMEQERRGQEMHLCVGEGTLVLTRQHGYVPIEHIRVGEDVLTHKGRWRAVIAKQCTGLRLVVALHAQGVPGLRLTPDHKVWARKVKDNVWSVAHARKAAQSIDPAWLESGFSKGSYVNLPIPPIIEMSELSAHEWWLVGRWLADGHIGTRGDYFISVGPDKLSTFLEHAGSYAGMLSAGTAIQVRLKNLSPAIKHILPLCGRGAAHKHVPPQAFGLDTHLSEALLQGYLSGDGHYALSRQRWMATSVSKALLLGLSLVAQRAKNVVTSVYAGRPAGQSIIMGRHVSVHQEWIWSFQEHAKRPSAFLADDGAWKKVRSIIPAGEQQTWNLRVEDDESFVVEGCVVKNCPMQYDIVDRLITQLSMPGELVMDPFSGIGTVPYRALLLNRKGLGIELNARYHADAVRYCKEAEAQRDVPTLFDLMTCEREEIAQ